MDDMSLVFGTVALTFTISTQRTALDDSTGLLPYQICGSLICILQSAVTCRSLQPLTSKALRTKSTGENCIRPQLHDLVFYTSTFHPSPVTSPEDYYPLPSVSHPSQSCRYQQVFYFYCPNELISPKKSNPEEVISPLVQLCLLGSLQMHLTGISASATSVLPR